MSGFTFLLMLPGGEPPDPACFVTAVPNWREGEEFMVSRGGSFRILGINDDIDVEGPTATRPTQKRFARSTIIGDLSSACIG